MSLSLAASYRHYETGSGYVHSVYDTLVIHLMQYHGKSDHVAPRWVLNLLDTGLRTLEACTQGVTSLVNLLSSILNPTTSIGFSQFWEP